MAATHLVPGARRWRFTTNCADARRWRSKVEESPNGRAVFDTAPLLRDRAAVGHARARRQAWSGGWFGHRLLGMFVAVGSRAAPRARTPRRLLLRVAGAGSHGGMALAHLTLLLASDLHALVLRSPAPVEGIGSAFSHRVLAAEGSVWWSRSRRVRVVRAAVHGAAAAAVQSGGARRDRTALVAPIGS